MDSSLVIGLAQAYIEGRVTAREISLVYGEEVRSAVMEMATTGMTPENTEGMLL